MTGLRNILPLLSGLLLAGSMSAAEPLDFLVYGASGKVGRQVVSEALQRGHSVTAVSRDPARIETQHAQLRVVQGDVLDGQGMRELLAGQDIVVISVRGAVDDSGDMESAVAWRAVHEAVDALREAPGPRLIHVGGSGSLMLPNGKRFADTIPKLFIPKFLEVEIDAQVAVLEYLRGIDDVPWTYITPPENFTNGERTGEFRIGGDLKLEDSQSRSRISRADFAVALVNEAEAGQFIGQRFSVAY